MNAMGNFCTTMCWQKFVAYLVVVLVTNASVHSNSCPEQCTCMLDEITTATTVNCKDAKLLQWPHFSAEAAKDVSVLVMDNNPISTMNFSDLSQFPRLQSVSFRYCLIKKVHISDVVLPSLQSLDLSHNLLTNINGNNSVFESVTTLNLNNNLLKDMPLNLFALFPGLENLYLANNVFRQIGTETFSCKNEQTNEKRCQSLRTFVLRNNMVTTVNGKSFEQLKSLFGLDLSRNRLSQIPSEAFTGLVNLEHLDLSRNYISEIPQDVFDPLQKLKFLHLNHNQFETIPSNLPMLEWLDISHNDIQFFKETLKSVLYPVEFFNFAHNPLTCDCKMTWLKELYDQRKYLAKHSDVAPEEFVPHCARPAFLAGVKWDDLPNNMLTCDKDVCEDCDQDRSDFQPHQLTVSKSGIGPHSVKIDWKLVGSPPVFSTIFVQYYIFGLQALSLKHVEVSIFQKQVQIKSLRAKTNYRFCVIPRLSAADDGDKVMSLSHSHCVEATTLEYQKTEYRSLMWLMVYYLIGMVGTVLFLIVALIATAFVASFFSNINNWSDKLTDVDEPYTDDESEAAYQLAKQKKREEKHSKHKRHHHSKARSLREKKHEWESSNSEFSKEPVKECLITEKVLQSDAVKERVGALLFEESEPSSSTEEVDVGVPNSCKATTYTQFNVNSVPFRSKTDQLALDKPTTLPFVIKDDNTDVNLAQRQTAVQTFIQQDVKIIKPKARERALQNTDILKAIQKLAEEVPSAELCTAQTLSQEVKLQIRNHACDGKSSSVTLIREKISDIIRDITADCTQPEELVSATATGHEMQSETGSQISDQVSSWTGPLGNKISEIIDQVVEDVVQEQQLAAASAQNLEMQSEIRSRVSSQTSSRFGIIPRTVLEETQSEKTPKPDEFITVSANEPQMQTAVESQVHATTKSNIEVVDKMSEVVHHICGDVAKEEPMESVTAHTLEMQSQLLNLEPHGFVKDVAADTSETTDQVPNGVPITEEIQYPPTIVPLSSPQSPIKETQAEPTRDSSLSVAGEVVKSDDFHINPLQVTEESQVQFPDMDLVPSESNLNQQLENDGTSKSAGLRSMIENVFKEIMDEHTQSDEDATQDEIPAIFRKQAQKEFRHDSQEETSLAASIGQLVQFMKKDDTTIYTHMSHAIDEDETGEANGNETAETLKTDRVASPKSYTRSNTTDVVDEIPQHSEDESQSYDEPVVESVPQQSQDKSQTSENAKGAASTENIPAQTQNPNVALRREASPQSDLKVDASENHDFASTESNATDAANKRVETNKNPDDNAKTQCCTQEAKPAANTELPEGPESASTKINEKPGTSDTKLSDVDPKLDVNVAESHDSQPSEDGDSCSSSLPSIAMQKDSNVESVSDDHDHLEADSTDDSVTDESDRVLHFFTEPEKDNDVWGSESEI